MRILKGVPRCWLAVALTLLAGGYAAERRVDSGKIYDRAKAASVEVLVSGYLAGSGWFARNDGFIVTAAHVIGEHKDAIEIVFRAVGRLAARVIAMDRGHDLALLHAERAGTRVPFLAVADRMPDPGEDVYLFAAPMFRHEVMIRGAVGRRSPTFEYIADQGHYIEVYHISAPSPPGTSGGCWLNSKGEVVGSQSAFISKDGVGLGIALVPGPKAIGRLVRTRRSVATPCVGSAFEELWSQPTGFIARFPKGTSGLVPVLPAKGGPAERAGLVGDMVIVAVDGRPVRYRDAVLRAIRAKRPGELVTFSSLLPDGGARREIRVKLTQF